MLTEKNLPTPDGTIHYVEGPRHGRPLVLLHGFYGRWQLNLPLIMSLTPRYHILAPDLRGHGQSSWTPGAYHLRDFAADINALVCARTEQPTVLVGMSLGGAVALATAAEAPESVTAVIAVDPPLAAMTEDPSSIAGMSPFFTALRALLLADDTDDAKIGRLAELLPRHDPLTLRRQFHQLKRFDPEQFTWFIEQAFKTGMHLAELLPRVACPVLLIQCNPALGGLLHDETAQTAAALLPDCIHVYRADAGHTIHLDQPALVTRMIADFVEML